MNYGILISLNFLFCATLWADPRGRDQESLNRSLRAEAITGAIFRIEELVRLGAKLDSQAAHGETALDYAVRFGRHRAAMRLVEMGANPNIDDDSGISPLSRAAADCNASRVVESFIRKGADVNHRDLYGRTALMNAAHADCARTVAIILELARDVVKIDAEDDALETATDLAKNGLIPQMLELARQYQNQEKDSNTLARELRSLKY